MKNPANKNIQKMKQYMPPLDLRRCYKGYLLDFNEKMVKLDDKIKSKLLTKMSQESLQLYPEYFDVERRIAKYVGVSARKIMITNGSDQGIDVIFRTFTERNDKVIIPAPSFAMFYQCAQIESNNIVNINYEEDLSYPVEKILSTLKKEKIKLIVLCNPNNPTGILVSLKDVEKIAKKARQTNTILYIDEAYFEFSQITAVKLIAKYPNIIITRTFSKAFGLAGLRMGYVVADPKFIREMLKIRGPYDINIISCYAVQIALKNINSPKKYARMIMKVVKPKIERFFANNKIAFYPSAANFILFKPFNPLFVFKTMEKNGIRLRPKQGVHIDGTVRVTIGTSEQMDTFMDVYKNKIINSEKYATKIRFPRS